MSFFEFIKPYDLVEAEDAGTIIASQFGSTIPTLAESCVIVLKKGSNVVATQPKSNNLHLYTDGSRL